MLLLESNTFFLKNPQQGFTYITSCPYNLVDENFLYILALHRITSNSMALQNICKHATFQLCSVQSSVLTMYKLFNMAVRLLMS